MYGGCGTHQCTCTLYILTLLAEEEAQVTEANLIKYFNKTVTYSWKLGAEAEQQNAAITASEANKKVPALPPPPVPPSHPPVPPRSSCPFELWTRVQCSTTS